ncbi:protein serine/threonine phosphatase [Desulfomicrobium baculatum DSM 4028]|uniref:Protein serine/threonine phosphatase n=1 Tax=Desulfomicrobium baculatum (strain DSM 4028 / VKM B-1378 / X) TaxID=525897 RepID=C7LVD1_DESBD|nr:protein serine/threonine phosphatase [Desulfomicrobium baculatum DSM 4028]
MLGAHLVGALFLRHVLVRLFVRPLPVQRQATRLLFLDFIVFVGTGLGVGVYHNLVWGFPVSSGLEVVIGFATIGLFAALDLSLEWEYRIIKQAHFLEQSLPDSKAFFPQTRRFALLASGIIIFVTIVLLLLLVRDISWLKAQDQAAALGLSFLLRSVVLEVLFVMGVLLVLTMLLVFSYARNLDILFENQTKVLERVSQGRLDSKVPVVTNDEFAVIAGHTNFMIDRLVEREQMAQGLELARQIQTSLLPTFTPFLPGARIFGTSLFCDETGGDFYDYMVRDGEHGPQLVIMIGDVTGHGVGSALLMASVRAYMKAHLLQTSDLAEVMNRTNTLISRDVAGSGHFVTVFLLSFCPIGRRVEWVGAGHDPAIFQPFDGGEVRSLAGRDIPLGVDPTWRYGVTEDRLGEGVLLMGTDGIWEAVDARKTMFGKERMLKVLRENVMASPQEIAERILTAVDSFTGNARVEDDRTVVIARLTES